MYLTSIASMKVISSNDNTVRITHLEEICTKGTFYVVIVEILIQKKDSNHKSYIPVDVFTYLPERDSNAKEHSIECYEEVVESIQDCIQNGCMIKWYDILEREFNSKVQVTLYQTNYNYIVTYKRLDDNNKLIPVILRMCDTLEEAKEEYFSYCLLGFHNCNVLCELLFVCDSN